jgi:hypothetical protein
LVKAECVQQKGTKKKKGYHDFKPDPEADEPEKDHHAHKLALPYAHPEGLLGFATIALEVSVGTVAPP